MRLVRHEGISSKREKQTRGPNRTCSCDPQMSVSSKINSLKKYQKAAKQIKETGTNHLCISIKGNNYYNMVLAHELAAGANL